MEHDPGALRPVLDLIDPVFGPIKNLRGMRQAFPQPGWWVYVADLCKPMGRYFVKNRGNAMGTSLDGSEALRRVLGEAVERYISYNSYKDEQSRLIKTKDNPILDLFPRCAQFEPARDLQKALPPELELTHVEVKRLSDDSDVWIPASFVHMGFTPQNDNEPILAPIITTGTGFHLTLEDALWSGLCEVAERDALMLMWHNQTTPRRIEITRANAPLLIRERLERLNVVGYKAHLFDITTDFRVPSIFCILESKVFPYYIVSASVADTAETCIAKAIDESMVVRYAQYNFGNRQFNADLKDFNWVHDLEQRANLYAHWQNSPALSWLLDSPNSLSFGDFANSQYWSRPVTMSEFKSLAKRLEMLDLTVLWQELVSADMRGLGHCARVVVPQMIPLTVQQSSRWLATPRMNKFREQPGKSLSDFNNFPHPFA
jgi:ribosomal protein S12 methylthiotransferase accessory factor